MKKMGVDGLLSSKDLENSTLRPSTNLLPIFSSTKFLGMWGILGGSRQAWGCDPHVPGEQPLGV